MRTILLSATLLGASTAAASPTPAELLSRINALQDKLQDLSVAPDGDLHLTNANLRIVDGSDETHCRAAGSCSGVGNLILGYDELVLPWAPADRDGTHNIIVGQGHARRGSAGIVVGHGGLLDADGAVATGHRPVVVGDGSVVLGGSQGRTGGAQATVIGGRSNRADNDAQQPVAMGGRSNVARSNHAAVVGGRLTSAGATYALAIGGQQSVATGWAATIAGGGFGQVSQEFALVLGGREAIASASKATVMGGWGIDANQAEDVDGATTAGPNGVRGPKGFIGAVGNRGSKGDRGPTGSRPSPAAFAACSAVITSCLDACAGGVESSLAAGPNGCTISANNGSTCGVDGPSGWCCVCDY